jgi:Domain of unknown function (DUF4259)
MGAWGVGAFENDTAADWDFEFEAADRAAGLRLITDALARAAGPGDGADLDGREGSRAVAAAELVALIDGQPIDESGCNKMARQWIAQERPEGDPALTSLARQAVSRVIGPASELPKLWLSDSLPEWRSAMTELLDKLKP